jgi:hypothetical protein
MSAGNSRHSLRMTKFQVERQFQHKAAQHEEQKDR